DGGSILAKADLTAGQTKFEQGAVLDVSGGVIGGNGGFAELSAASVRLGGQFLAQAAQGYRGGRFLIDPITSQVTTADLQAFSGSGASDVEFRSPDGTDLNVNATFNLSAWILPVGQAGVLRFTAGNNLIFGATSTTSIRNGSFNGTGAVSRWDYEGRAG